VSPASAADGPGTAWPADVDPADLEQPDGFSCGPTAVVAARMLLDPTWRPDAIEEEIAVAHHGLTGVAGLTGRTQLPWPRALGTPPWAVANVLAALTGQRVSTYVARHRPAPAYAELARRVAIRPTAAYLGSAWLPRHVVLAYDGDLTAVEVLDPARGELVSVAADRWRTHDVRVAGWSHLWFVV